jgi:hypothetical protein
LKLQSFLLPTLGSNTSHLCAKLGTFLLHSHGAHVKKHRSIARHADRGAISVAIACGNMRSFFGFQKGTSEL